MTHKSRAERIIASRGELTKELAILPKPEMEAEGGCGVTGFACSVPVRGKHIFEPSKQMHNRGNGLGGGISAMGLVPEDLGVSREILEEDYLVHIAVLEDGIKENVMAELPDEFIHPLFRVDHQEKLATLDDFREIEGLRVRPPDIHRYFVRVKDEVLDEFIKSNNLENITRRQAEDEFVYQNSFRLGQKYYDPFGKQHAFVMSHARNMFILKIVGYAEEVVRYYQIEDLKAHAWIAHQRYPTKGKVWHPGGAHPFIGLNEALVHNGDFANYLSVCEYLAQRNIYPQFLTDTEVSVLLFDLYRRVYSYPLEYVIEALAPTMERDFDMLPAQKQEVYRAIQATHIHGSPDGPWFFIIARNDTEEKKLRLIGITDTSMLRPQVFALHEGEVQVGLICSEKQAIDATLKSLSEEDPRVGTVADIYWNARGGSHTDGGSFIFTLEDTEDPLEKKLVCTDKFGTQITAPENQAQFVPGRLYQSMHASNPGSPEIVRLFLEKDARGVFELLKAGLKGWTYDEFLSRLIEIKGLALQGGDYFYVALESLTLMIDSRYPTHDKKRRSILQLLNHTLERMLGSLPKISEETSGSYRLVDWDARKGLRGPKKGERVLAVDASGFPPEGDDCDSRLIVDAFLMGWKRFIVFGLKGQRFHGCGLGPETRGVFMDIYGSSGDYLASGIDGLTITVHGNAQDQVGQIMKQGKLVIYGDTGQTFLYGAKGGEVYVMGNAAGRPLINAVGRPRVVINGTCLDYLAESFMAGDPLGGGGFAVLNGITFDHDGNVVEQPEPYPGSNLFSLASGGAIYVRDPGGLVNEEMLNGGVIRKITQADWELILPHLKENERLFGIQIERDLLTVNGEKKSPLEVYRKVVPGDVWGTGEKMELDGLEEWGES